MASDSESDADRTGHNVTQHFYCPVKKFKVKKKNYNTFCRRTRRRAVVHKIKFVPVFLYQFVNTEKRTGRTGSHPPARQARAARPVRGPALGRNQDDGGAGTDCPLDGGHR